MRLNEKLEVNKICNLIFHTSCLILHVSYSILPYLIASCFVVCTCPYSHTSYFQTFNPSFQETETLSCDTPQLEAHTTLFFISDGLRLYWIYVLKQHETVSTGTGGSSGDKTKIHNVYLQVLNVNVSVLICMYMYYYDCIFIYLFNVHVDTSLLFSPPSPPPLGYQ